MERLMTIDEVAEYLRVPVLPIRRPEVTIGGRGSPGTAFRLTVMPMR
jgi:hypothetical protein